MNAATYLSRIAQQLGFTYVPKCTTFKTDYQSSKKGAVIGVRKGYLAALALTAAKGHGYGYARSSGFAMMVRYPKSSSAAQITEALKNRPGFSSFFGKKTVKAADDGVLVSWTYAFGKTKQEEVIALLDAVIEEVSKYAPAFTGKCEDCGTAEAREITLMNGTPGYHCSGCQMRIAADKQREADEYRTKDANYVLGLFAGLFAAAVSGSAWGWLIGLAEGDTGQWSPKLHALAGVLISIPICLLMFKVIGKRDRAGQIMAVVLTLAAKWWGDVIYFTHVWMHFQHVAFSWPLANSVLKRFFEIKLTDGWHIFVTICDIVISVAIPWTPWGKLPNFVPVFQTIQPDGTLTQTLTQGVAAQ